MNKLAKWKAFGLAGGMKSAEIFFSGVVPLLNCLDKGKGSVFLYVNHTKPKISLFALTQCYRLECQFKKLPPIYITNTVDETK